MASQVVGLDAANTGKSQRKAKLLSPGADMGQRSTNRSHIASTNAIFKVEKR